MILFLVVGDPARRRFHPSDSEPAGGSRPGSARRVKVEPRPQAEQQRTPQADADLDSRDTIRAAAEQRRPMFIGKFDGAWLWSCERSVLLREMTRPAFRALNVIIALLLCASPVFAAVWVGASVRHAVLSLLWMGFIAGFGEELFFRGYIQSHVNETFGRPWSFLGIPFGPGLLVSSLLFGFIHALNSVDYFAGEYHFAWGYGLMTMGLFAGFVRERVGSIWPGVVMHVLGNILGLAAAVAAGL